MKIFATAKTSLKTIVLLTLTALTNCSGSTSDPTTSARSDLNPPGSLSSVTASAANTIELRWNAANTEKDFKGYDVFAVIGDMSTVGTPTYPEKTDLASGSIPRCEKNSDLFMRFGFKKPSTKTCKGGDTSSSSSFSNSELKTEETEEVLENFIKCVGETSANVSLSKSPGVLQEQVCKITQAYDPVNAKIVDIAAGTTYTFFVVAVMGDKFNKISWTSNFIEDTPPVEVFSEDITLEKNTYKIVNLDAANLNATLSKTTIDATKATCPANGADGENNACEVYKVNEDSAAANKYAFFLGRKTATTTQRYPQRILFSTPANSGLSYLYRGQQTNDPNNEGEISKSTPDDHAIADAASSLYVSDGAHTAVYGNQVFDIKVIKDSSTFYYGKVVFKDPTYADESDTTSLVTVNMTVLIQPTKNVVHYFSAK